jgi:hypothetical protein
MPQSSFPHRSARRVGAVRPNDIAAAPNAGPHRTQKRNDYGSIALTQDKQDYIMTKTATPRQRKTTGRVMHEFKHGELKSGRGGKGGKVKSRRQAIAIALKEAGASKYESAKTNKRNLARSKRKEARGDTNQQGKEGNSHVGALGRRESSPAMGGENATRTSAPGRKAVQTRARRGSRAREA